MQRLPQQMPAQQLCRADPRTGNVIGSVGVAGVAKIGGEQGQKRLYIRLLLMPKGEARDGKAMPQIMRPQAPAMVEPGQCAGSYNES